MPMTVTFWFMAIRYVESRSFGGDGAGRRRREPLDAARHRTIRPISPRSAEPPGTSVAKPVLLVRPRCAPLSRSPTWTSMRSGRTWWQAMVKRAGAGGGRGPGVVERRCGVGSRATGMAGSEGAASSRVTLGLAGASSRNPAARWPPCGEPRVPSTHSVDRRTGLRGGVGSEVSDPLTPASPRVRPPRSRPGRRRFAPRRTVGLRG